ncbi:MAG: hypothetical protein AB2L13_07055 [Spirochaetota bacterium]
MREKGHEKKYYGESGGKSDPQYDAKPCMLVMSDIERHALSLRGGSWISIL